ncbi:MAG: IS66 family transposase [Planctomycetes bacterium]|nr:IS66 family transposase [Planctomycetota bacterium]
MDYNHLMQITEESFQTFLKCETKSYLKIAGAVGLQSEFRDWERFLAEDFQQKCSQRLISNFQQDERFVGTISSQELENKKYRIVIDCIVQSQRVQSRIQALEQLPSPGRTKHNHYIPIRFIPREKITAFDKLLIAFDAFVLFTASGRMPQFGKIIHGSEQKTIRVKLDRLMKVAESIITRIIAQQAGSTEPPLILNKHCVECEFQLQCRQSAIQKDELTLLSGMTEKERCKLHSKGLFSITQLSYTFRPRRRPKRSLSKPNKYYPALRALAIREQKIHIAGNRELDIGQTPIYIDVEGTPDRESYYLIGLRIKSGESYVQHSFWANDMSEEKEIWASFLQIISKVESPRLIYYGSYEALFLKHMKDRYPEAIGNATLLDRLIAESVNILSVIYAHIYFPTYTNGLKDIGRYLGFQWSDTNASGSSALIWRSKWEVYKEAGLKQKLLTYNAEDCEVLERVTNAVAQLCQRQTEVAKSKENDIVYADTLRLESSYRFGKNDFSVPELEYINQAAYWHYQRDRIYVRTSQRLKRIHKEKTTRVHAKPLPINKVIEFDGRPSFCIKCEATKIYKYGRMIKIVYDLKFGRAGIKRWIVKYCFNRYLCWKCGYSFYLQKRPWTRSRYGSELRSYLIYQIIELRLPQHVIALSLNQLFGFDLGVGAIANLKIKSAQLYKGTYEAILTKIGGGSLLHVDESKISLEGKDGFVWVFTNLEEVVYFYTDTRDGDAVQSLLKDFKGVLVSDFYAVYDGIDCPQQKCLIHLIRDLNDDLLKQPFNEELKELVQHFAGLVKPMVETVDRHGLKSHFLRKHKVFVERFYKNLSKHAYKSEIAVKYKKRFDKNRDKLFTFLDYDGVPWNNNNAEHAIKAFAALRKVIGGTSTNKGIRDYLILLSICETCKYKGVSFLDFLRSREKDIDEFIMKSKGVKCKPHRGGC